MTLTTPKSPAQAIEAAQKRLKGIALRTPLELNASLSAQYECEVWLKREDLQVVRSYKLRGAHNKMASLDAAEKAAGDRRRGNPGAGRFSTRLPVPAGGRRRTGGRRVDLFPGKKSADRRGRCRAGRCCGHENLDHQRLQHHPRRHRPVRGRRCREAGG